MADSQFALCPRLPSMFLTLLNSCGQGFGRLSLGLGLLGAFSRRGWAWMWGKSPTEERSRPPPLRGLSCPAVLRALGERHGSGLGPLQGHHHGTCGHESQTPSDHLGEGTSTRRTCPVFPPRVAESYVVPTWESLQQLGPGCSCGVFHPPPSGYAY